ADHLFLHITVTNPSAYSSNDRHAQAIEGIGISRFPNTGISYNMGVMPDAAIYEFQPVGRRGAHTVNDKGLATCVTTGCPGRGGSLSSSGHGVNLNWNARAIALCQNTSNVVTSAQVHSIARTAATWKRCGYVRRTARWHGHRCVSARACPGDRAWALMAELNRLTEYYYVNGIEDEDMTECVDRINVLIAQEAARYQVYTDRYVDLRTRIDALTAEADIDLEELAAISAAAQAGAAAVWDPEAMAAALAPLLPAVDQDDLEAALRAVLGSLDETAEPPT
ncbi:MAG: peptidoglycan recognition protein family protein, partial [Acidimicrobiales bacterium]